MENESVFKIRPGLSGEKRMSDGLISAGKSGNRAPPEGAHVKVNSPVMGDSTQCVETLTLDYKI